MKTIRNISLVGLTIMFVLSSCTMEKRVYRSGYHTEWLTAKHRGHNGNYKNGSLCTPVQEDSSEQLDQTTVAATEQTTVEPDLIDDNTTSTNDGIDIVASVDNKQIILPKKTKNDWLSKTTEKPKNDEEQKPTFKSEFKKGAKMILANGDEPKTNGLALAGFICSLAGLFIFGFILGALAIIFSAIGLGKINKDSSKWKGKEFAIAGLVIGIVDIVAWLIILALLL